MGRNRAVAGCVQDISALVASGEVWDAILDALSDKFDLSQNIEQTVHKDLYVTEAIRHAVVPSVVCVATTSCRRCVSISAPRQRRGGTMPVLGRR